MTDNTPLPEKGEGSMAQSNGDGILEQRIYEEIAVIFAGKDLSHEQIAALMDDRRESVELIMQLITADRKRVALEAKKEGIDTLITNWNGFIGDMPDDKKSKLGYLELTGMLWGVAMITQEKLKAQQEKVK